MNEPHVHTRSPRGLSPRPYEMMNGEAEEFDQEVAQVRAWRSEEWERALAAQCHLVHPSSTELSQAMSQKTNLDGSKRLIATNTGSKSQGRRRAVPQAPTPTPRNTGATRGTTPGVPGKLQRQLSNASLELWINDRSLGGGGGGKRRLSMSSSSSSSGALPEPLLGRGARCHTDRGLLNIAKKPLTDPVEEYGERFYNAPRSRPVTAGEVSLGRRRAMSMNQQRGAGKTSVLGGRGGRAQSAHQLGGGEVGFKRVRMPENPLLRAPEDVEELEAAIGGGMYVIGDSVEPPALKVMRGSESASYHPVRDPWDPIRFAGNYKPAAPRDILGGSDPRAVVRSLRVSRTAQVNEALARMGIGSHGQVERRRGPQGALKRQLSIDRRHYESAFIERTADRPSANPLRSGRRGTIVHTEALGFFKSS